MRARSLSSGCSRSDSANAPSALAYSAGSADTRACWTYAAPSWAHARSLAGTRRSCSCSASTPVPTLTAAAGAGGVAGWSEPPPKAVPAASRPPARTTTVPALSSTRTPRLRTVTRPPPYGPAVRRDHGRPDRSGAGATRTSLSDGYRPPYGSTGSSTGTRPRFSGRRRAYGPGVLSLTAVLHPSALDARLSVVRLHPEVQAALGVRPDDVVVLRGRRTTAARVAPAPAGGGRGDGAVHRARPRQPAADRRLAGRGGARRAAGRPGRRPER